MQGRFTGEVEVVDGGFRVNGKEGSETFSEPDASKLPWKDLNMIVLAGFSIKIKHKLILKQALKSINLSTSYW